MWYCAPEESRSDQNDPYHAYYMNQPTSSLASQLAPLSSQPSSDPLPSKLPLQKTAVPTKKPKRSYNKRSNKANKGMLSFEVMTGLAVLNGQGQAMSAKDVYSFIIQYWPAFRDGKYTTWKNSVRNRLAEKELFIRSGGPTRSTYILNENNPGWVHRRVKEEEEKRLKRKLPIDVYGLEDSSVWNAMISGSLGVPSCVEHKKLRRSSFRKEENMSSEEYIKAVMASANCEKKPKIEETPEELTDGPIKRWEFNFLLSMNNQFMHSQEQINPLQQYYTSLPLFEQMPIYSGFYDYYGQQTPFELQDNPYATGERTAPYEYKPNEVPLEEIEPSVFH